MKKLILSALDDYKVKDQGNGRFLISYGGLRNHLLCLQIHILVQEGGGIRLEVYQPRPVKEAELQNASMFLSHINLQLTRQGCVGNLFLDHEEKTLFYAVNYPWRFVNTTVLRGLVDEAIGVLTLYGNTIARATLGKKTPQELAKEVQERAKEVMSNGP